MKATQSAGDTQEFRYGAAERYLLAVAVAVLWLLLIVIAGFAASLAYEGQIGLALFLLALTGFLTTLCRMVTRDYMMKTTWRISLGPVNAWFDLPLRRLLYGPAPRISGPLACSAIRAIEWREEAFRTMGMATINRVYAIRLKSGGLILLGEDRPIPKTYDYTTLAGNAARAQAHKAGAPLRQKQMAEGNGGFLTLWGTQRPDWPDGQEAALLTEEEERLIRRNQRITQLVPVIAFAVTVLVSLLP